MAAREVPQTVLIEALTEAIDGRPVRCAVFTTFNFDPGFFELHVLPALFDVGFNRNDNVKRLQLEDTLGQVEDVAVYYDRSALAQDGSAPKLDFRRIGVSNPHGVLHPKLVLILVRNLLEVGDDDGEYEPSESLIVGVLSANLTRAGWWENLEVGHFEEIDDRTVDGGRCTFRKDLIALTRQLATLGGRPEEQVALDRIQTFLKRRTSRKATLIHSSKSVHYTRLFYGQKSFPDWLLELNLHREKYEWNLEVISPYFDAGQSSTLQRLMEAVGAQETRVYLPLDARGQALIKNDLYGSIDEIAWWSKLPATLLRPGARGKMQEALPRFVHAKIYRLWNKAGKQVLIVGSVNLTSAAHSRMNAGNLEASFLVDMSHAEIPNRWWLERLEQDPEEFAEQTVDEESPTERVFLEIDLQFDWIDKELSYRVPADYTSDLALETRTGEPLFSISNLKSGGWRPCEPGAAQAVEQLLVTSSLVRVVHEKGSWCVLIREEGMSHRPSIIGQLTPEEILEYWSMLTPEQRESLFIRKLELAGLTLDGLPQRTGQLRKKETLFDRFAGMYHAFERSFKHIADNIVSENYGEAETRLFGAKYHSLPELLNKIKEQEEDPVTTYLAFLCAKQTYCTF